MIDTSSGEKDSLYHIFKYKYGMHHVITWAPFEYTNIGFKIFRNYIKIVD